MTLAPGNSEGGSDNRHGGSDHWLYVVSETRAVIVNGNHYPLCACLSNPTAPAAAVPPAAR